VVEAGSEVVVVVVTGLPAGLFSFGSFLRLALLLFASGPFQAPYRLCGEFAGRFGRAELLLGR
jgi:hypothetical protein